jgi:PKD repeat protein
MKRLLLVLVVIGLLVAGVSGEMWTPRLDHTTVVMSDGDIILMGGYDNSNALNDTWKSTDDGVTWTLVNASSGWEARQQHSSIVLSDGSILIMGGLTNDYVSIGDTWRSTDKGSHWELMNTSADWPPRRSLSALPLSDGSAILFGGTDDSAPLFNDVWSSSDNGVIWNLVNTSSAWDGREDHRAIIHPDNTIIMVGGLGGSGPKGDIWASVDGGNVWSSINTTADWGTRTDHTLVRLPDGSIVLMAGTDEYSSVFNDTWRSINNGSTWTQINSSSGWQPRIGSSSVVTSDGEIIIMGGQTTEPGVNDSWMSSDNGVSWEQTGPSLSLVADFNHVPNPSTKNQQVIFNDTSVAGYFGNPVTWNWTFGDTGTSTSKNTTHTYTDYGTHTVSLNVTDSSGNWSNTSKSHSVIELSPVASFTCTPTTVALGSLVVCNDTSTNYPTSWYWTFGDGTNSTSQNVTQIYGASGTYTVSLQVSNGNSTNTLTKNSYIIILPFVSDGGFATLWQQQTSDAGWEPRHSMGYTITPNGDLFIAGGMSTIIPLVTFNDTWKSSDNGITWTLQSTGNAWGGSVGGGRFGHRLDALADGSLLITGGGIYNPTGVCKNDTWRSTDDGITWTLVSNSSGYQPRSGHSSTVLSDGSILIAGGADIYGNVFTDVWRSTNNGTSWTKMTDNIGIDIPWGTSYAPMTALNNSEVLLIGGTRGVGGSPVYGNISSVRYSSNYGANWTIISDTPINQDWAYIFPACYSKGFGVIYLGGYNFTFVSKDGGLTWGYGNGSFGANGQPPYDRNSHGGVCTENGNAIVFGGATNSSGIYLNDVWITSTSYLQTFNITDFDTGLPIPIVKLVDNFGQTFYTSNGTGYLMETNGYYSVDFSSSGYTSRNLSYYSSANASHSVTLTAAPTDPAQNTWWTPHTVQVTVMDTNYGTRLYDVNIQAHYNETSMPDNWISTLYGIGSTVQADMINRTLIMNGTTGSAGTVTFTMLGSIKYDFTLNSASYGISNYKAMEWPSDNMLNIYVLTTGSLLPTQRNSTYTNLNGTRVYFTEPDINNVSMCIDYIDTSGETSSVTFIWKFTNGTTLNTSTVNPGTGLNTICNVTRNIRGTQIYWGYNATRNPVTV